VRTDIGVPTGFRLLRKGKIGPFRGTFCSAKNDTFLFTSGYVPWWREYPGPHIPAPLQIGSSGKTDIAERAAEILALTKMNWNSADGVASRQRPASVEIDIFQQSRTDHALYRKVF